MLAARTETYQYESLKKIEVEGLQAVRLMHAAIGLSGDAGEVCSVVEKYVYYKQDLDRLNLIEELGDCLWYIALACNVLEVDMGNVMATNIAKLQERYPNEGFDKDQATEANRDREREREAMETPCNCYDPISIIEIDERA